MSNFFKTAGWTLLFLFIAAALIFSAWKFKGCSGCNGNFSDSETVVIHDTTTVIRYEKEIQRDTIIKWYERVLWKEAKPEIIYQQKVDTLFKEKIRSFDLMLKVDKRGSRLKVFAYNENDSLLKEQLFTVSDDFTITSKARGLFVKSKLFDWNKVDLKYNHYRTAGNLKGFEHTAGIRTGINYKSKLSFDVSADYDLKQKSKKFFDNFIFNAEISYKLFK